MEDRYEPQADAAQAEIHELYFAGPAPDAAELPRTWHAMLAETGPLVAALPAEKAGTCVLGPGGDLYRGSPEDLAGALQRQQIVFHPGRIRGARPKLVTLKSRRQNG